MKPVYIFRHVLCEGPGYLGDVLDRHQVPYKIICTDEGVDIPSNLNDVAGLIFMGGFMNVTDSLSWIAAEQALICKAIDRGMPVMGICLGAQLMSVALGGTVQHDPAMEIGWHPLQPSCAVNDQSWFNQLPDGFTPFHWHADTFSIPQGAKPLLQSQCRENQAFAIGNSLAMQFHLEMTSAMVEDWVKQYSSDLKQGHPCTQTATEILQGLDAKIDALHHYADIVYGEWIKGLSRSD